MNSIESEIAPLFDPKIAWSIFPDRFAERASEGRWKPYRHLQYISKIIGMAVAKGGARIIVTCPPRHGKSELISNWLPTWFLYHYPERKVILASYAAEFASKWGAQVRSNLTENSIISVGLSKSTKSKKQFQTLEGGQMICAGMGGPITGQGAHLFIVDDPVKNYQDAVSPTIQKSHQNWFRGVATTRLEPGASVIILLTRWHENDLAGWLLDDKQHDNEMRSKYQLINLPAICESESDELNRPIGSALCPERYNEQALAQIEADLGVLHWSAMYQQRPTALEGNIVLKEWLKYYDVLPKDLDEIAIFCDLSYKEGPKTDFTVIEVWGRKGPNIYLIDQIRARMGFPEQIASIKEMAKRYPSAYGKYIEEHANGAAVIQVLSTEIMGVIPVKPKTSKEARLAAVSPIFQGGNVHYPNSNYHSWVDVNVGEILSFPNGKNDDTVDTACYAVSHFSSITSSVNALEALNRW